MNRQELKNWMTYHNVSEQLRVFAENMRNSEGYDVFASLPDGHCVVEVSMKEGRLWMENANYLLADLTQMNRDLAHIRKDLKHAKAELKKATETISRQKNEITKLQHKQTEKKAVKEKKSISLEEDA